MTGWTTSGSSVGRSLLILVAAVGSIAPAAPGTPPPEPWPQWGGPNRDFKLNSPVLADQWPAEGPKRLWSRPLGEGYSAIVADGDRLYTMYRQGHDEIIVALRQDTGETVWEHRCHAAPYAEQTPMYGQGPNASPLLFKGKLYTVGFTGLMHCLDTTTGKPHWSLDLVREFNGQVQYYGYANSPMAYKNTIITLVGGKEHGVVALAPDDGKILWKSKPFDVGYAPPVLINVDGQDQIVFFTTNEVVGIDAADGSYLWSHLVVNFCRTNCTPAIWGKDNLLWAATKGVGGTRVLKLAQHDGKTSVKEVWLNRKIRVYHWNSIRIGDRIYTSSGDNAPLLSVIDVKTGEVVDRQRGFGCTNVIYVDDKLILLDDGGKLALAEVSPTKIKIVSSAQVLDSRCWTVPTLVGKTLYVRDQRTIMALDLG